MENKLNNKKRKKIILFDKIIGEPIFWLLVLLKSRRKIEVTNIRNILLIKPGGIGDFLLNVPTFKEIRERFPEAKITLFIFNRNKICLELYDNFNEVIVIDNFKNLLRYIMGEKPWDLCIDFDQHRKIPSILTTISGAKIRIGFNNNSKEKAYNYPVEYREYEAQSFLNLLEPILGKIIIQEEDLILVKNEKKSANSIGIYACAMKEENRLPIEQWREIIEKYGKSKEYYFIGSKEDMERYDRLENALEGFIIKRFDGKLSLKESMELISKLSLLISEDGGVYHMAVCTGTPTISYWLHGRYNMDKWKAPFDKHKGRMIKSVDRQR